MYEAESLKLLRKVIKKYDELPYNVKNWLDKVVNRVSRNEQDLRTYLAMSKSQKDMNFFNSLNLKSDMSYYVVSSKREFLEKFRVYMQVCSPKHLDDLVLYSDKVFLNTYVRQVKEEKFDIDEMIVANRRLQIYCHKNNNMTDKQSAWIQGNLVASDICDRIIRGNKILVLSEYPVEEVDDLVGTIMLRKIVINDNDLQFHGLYNLNPVSAGGINPTKKKGNWET